MVVDNKPEPLGSLIKRETVEQQVYVALRRQILEGTLQPGQRLVQDDVAVRLGTSRIPVRGALKALATAGLLKLDSKGFYSVAHFGAADLEEIYDLRLILEPEAARYAIRNMTAAELEVLKATNRALRQAALANDRDQWTELNQQFHLSLYQASRRTRLVRMIRDLWVGRPSFSPIKNQKNLLQSVEEHERMIAAIEQRNAALLRKLVRDHIFDGGKQWSALLQSRNSSPAA